MQSCIVVAVMAPTTSARRQIAEMRHSARDLDVHIVEVCPINASGIAKGSEILAFSLRSPISRSCDGVIRCLDLAKSVVVVGGLVGRIAAKMRRHVRPIAQGLDRAIWPLPRPDEFDMLIRELGSLIARYDRSYTIFVGGQALTLTIELAKRLPFDAAGSRELFDLITGPRQVHGST